MTTNFIFSFLLRPFRRRRMKKFLDLFDISSETTILDVGGTPFNWQLINCPAKITLLNLGPSDKFPSLPKNINYVQGDGTKILYPDKSFDVVFSNSVIEHLQNFERQQLFAEEICRVGKNYFVQTPARSFFFEPHFLTPFFHYLPKRSQKRLFQNFTIWGLFNRNQKEYGEKMIDDINLLDELDLRKLFPHGRLETEKWFGMKKAYLVVNREENTPNDRTFK